MSWGNITVGGDTNPELAGLNRDTDKVQEITKDEITGSLDSSVTVDNRIFSESGRKEISDQHEHFTDNVVMAGAGAIGTVEGAAKFVGDAVGLGEKEYDKNGNEVETNAIDKWKANQSGMATGIRRGGTEDAQKIIKDMSEGFVSPEDLQKLAAMTADGSINLVYSNNQENVVFLDAAGNVIGVVARDGFNDLANNQGYVNLANGAGTDAYTFLRTDAEERAHNYVGSSETAASAAANNEMSYYNAVAGLTGGYTVAPGQYGAGMGTNAQSQYNQQYNGPTNNLLQNNNIQASMVPEANKADLVSELMAGIGAGYSYVTDEDKTKSYSEYRSQALDGTTWGAATNFADAVESIPVKLVIGAADTLEYVGGGFATHGEYGAVSREISEWTKDIPVGASDAIGIVPFLGKTLKINKLTKIEQLKQINQSIPGAAHSVNAQKALNSKLSGLEKAQTTAAKIRELPDGRIRYYGAEVPAKNPGKTKGASFVTEYDPATGNVNRVHPKSINGQEVKSTHYPLTGKELEELNK